jgi:ATP-binding cassette subfamily B protein
VLRLRVQVLRLLAIGERRLAVSLIVFGFAQGLLPLLFTVSVGALVGLIPEVVRDGFGSTSGTRLTWVLAGTTLVFAVLQVLDPIGSALNTLLRRQIDESLRAKTLEDLSKPPGIGHLEDPELRDHLSLIREGGLDLGSSPGGAAVTTVWLLADYIQAVGATLIVGVAFSWWVALGLLGACLLARRLFRHHLISYLTIWVQPRQLRLHRRHGYDDDLAVGPAAAKEARVFGLTDWFTERFGDDWDDAMREPQAVQGRLFRGFGFANGVLMLAFLALFVLLGDRTADGAIGIGALALVVQASFDTAVIANSQASDYELEFGSVVLPKVQEIETLASRAEARAGAVPSEEPSWGAVVFEDVAFRYPTGNRDVLKNVNLTLDPGRSVAIVGPNGAGKTTLVKLLAGLYEPTGGRITAGGVDLLDLDPADWQRRIAVIFQDFVRYELPARENVGFGSLEHLHDPAALASAASRSGALATIEELPSGWETILSRRYEGGTDLSGGEWQRVALARCHLAIEAGARILVLDEPTATLDVRAEVEFYERFVELTEGLTTILISHRFSSVRTASRIIVLDERGVREDGSHDELVAADGVYAQMFRLQAGRFTGSSEDEA